MIFFGPVILFLMVGHFQGDRKAVRGAVRNGLEQYFAGAMTNAASHSSNGTTWLTKDDLLAGFDNRNGSNLLDGGLILSNSVWVSSFPLNTSSSNLACVVRAFDREYYGIEGNGDFRRVSEAELEHWMRVPAGHLKSGSGINR